MHKYIIDSARHSHGVFGDGVCRALDPLEEQLGNVIAAMEAAGVYDQTNFIILSDHGQMNYEKRIRINVLLTFWTWHPTAACMTGRHTGRLFRKLTGKY